MVQFSTGVWHSDSQPHPFYAGEFRHAIDEKNRLTIPSRWRIRRGRGVHHSPRSAAAISPRHAAGGVRAHERGGGADPASRRRERRVFLRHLHARAQHGAADKQGRLVLPDELCRQLGLKGEVALVGGRGRFEIWNLQKWKRSQEDETRHLPARRKRDRSVIGAHHERIVI